MATAASRAGLGLSLFEHGRRVNESMIEFVADGVVKQLESLGKDPTSCTVLVAGLAFKGEPETGDLRESTALDIAARLRGRVGRLLGHDAVVSAEEIRAAGLEPVDLPGGAAGCDAVLVLNNHRSYQTLDVFELMRSLAPPGILFDGWHLFRPDDVIRTCPSVYMGLGFSRSSVDAPERAP
jgi:UDP-N-acetyl-D-mannosaminuronate dehydrogenase